MNKKDQHIDKLFQSLKQDAFMAPQSFMDDLKLRIDAKAKLAVRRKLTLWFVFTSMVLVTIASVIIYTLQGHSIGKANRKISLSEVRFNVNVDSFKLKSQNQNKVVRDDSVKLNKDAILSENDVNSKQEEMGRNDLRYQDRKESQDLNKELENSKSTKNKSSLNRKSAAKKQLSKTKSNVIVSNSTRKKLEEREVAVTESKSEVRIKAESNNKAALELKDNLSSLSNSQSSNQKNRDKLEKKLTEDKNSNPSNNAANLDQNASQRIEVVLQMRLKQEIANPFNLSLEENKSLLNNSTIDKNKSSKKLEFNLEAYGGALLTSSKYNPEPSANGFKSSPLFSPSFGVKTSLLRKNIYSSLGVEYFKTGDKQGFETKTFSQIGVDSIQTVTYSDTIWIDSVTFVFDTLIIKSHRFSIA